MRLRTVRLPRTEQARFETRAVSFFPREIEDYLLGRYRRGGLDVYMVLPTRTDDIQDHSTEGVTLKQIALNRARETARNMGLIVLGTVHTHPYKRWNGYGIGLSRADYAAFDWWPVASDILETPVMATCAVYRTGVTPDRYKHYWAFWLKQQALKLTWKTTGPFLGPESLVA